MRRQRQELLRPCLQTGSINLSDLFLWLLALAALGAGAAFFAAGKPLLESAVLGISVVSALVGAVVLFVKVLEWLYKEAPACPCGKSGHKDYTWVGMRHLHDRSTPTETHYVCPCGRHWMRRGNTFYEKLPDGGLQPYKRMRLLHWRNLPCTYR